MITRRMNNDTSLNFFRTCKFAIFTLFLLYILVDVFFNLINSI